MSTSERHIIVNVDIPRFVLWLAYDAMVESDSQLIRETRMEIRKAIENGAVVHPVEVHEA